MAYCNFRQWLLGIPNTPDSIPLICIPCSIPFSMSIFCIPCNISQNVSSFQKRDLNSEQTKNRNIADLVFSWSLSVQAALVLDSARNPLRRTFLAFRYGFNRFVVKGVVRTWYAYCKFECLDSTNHVSRAITFFGYINWMPERIFELWQLMDIWNNFWCFPQHQSCNFWQGSAANHQLMHHLFGAPERGLNEAHRIHKDACLMDWLKVRDNLPWFTYSLI